MDHQPEPADARRGNIARLVSDLCYAGKLLSEVAGYSTIQLNQMLLLKRDKWGKLVHPDDQLPPGVEVDDSGMRVISQEHQCSFTKAFARVKRRQGLSDDAAQRQWTKYLDSNPQLQDLIAASAKRAEQRRQRRANQQCPTA